MDEIKNQSKFGIPEFVSNRGNAGRRSHLQNLKNLRNNGGAAHNDFGSVVLSIPELDFYVLARRYPELVSPDPEINRNAWDRFLRSSESAPYRVRDTDRPGIVSKSRIVRP